MKRLEHEADTLGAQARAPILVELAKQLRLDPAHVQRTYLRRMREEMTTRGKEPG